MIKILVFCFIAIIWNVVNAANYTDLPPHLIQRNIAPHVVPDRLYVLRSVNQNHYKSVTDYYDESITIIKSIFNNTITAILNDRNYNVSREGSQIQEILNTHEHDMNFRRLFHKELPSMLRSINQIQIDSLRRGTLVKMLGIHIRTHWHTIPAALRMTSTCLVYHYCPVEMNSINREPFVIISNSILYKTILQNVNISALKLWDETVLWDHDEIESIPKQVIAELALNGTHSHNIDNVFSWFNLLRINTPSTLSYKVTTECVLQICDIHNNPNNNLSFGLGPYHLYYYKSGSIAEWINFIVKLSYYNYQHGNTANCDGLITSLGTIFFHKELIWHLYVKQRILAVDTEFVSEIVRKLKSTRSDWRRFSLLEVRDVSTFAFICFIIMCAVTIFTLMLCATILLIKWHEYMQKHDLVALQWVLGCVFWIFMEVAMEVLDKFIAIWICMGSVAVAICFVLIRTFGFCCRKKFILSMLCSIVLCWLVMKIPLFVEPPP